ncbi:MAG: hypothetical protein IT304_10680 [Dehalococcoidia bacterium]|nr:hypothetical protein [Dehalococcoidia bacterium]
MDAATGSLKAREFLFASEDLAMAALPGDFPRPERRVMWTILQLSFGRPDVHFELHPQVARRQVELGLHLEGPAELNALLAERLAERASDLIPALGEGWELEEWTASWRRLHRVYAFETLTRRLASEVGAELARALLLLVPVLQVLPVPAPQPEVRAHPPARRDRRRVRR